MTRREDVIVGQMDRRRERALVREERTARLKALEVRADAVAACAVADLPEHDQRDFVRFFLASVCRLSVVHHGPDDAAAMIGREAGEAGRAVDPRVDAIERAQRLFTTAANDRQSDD